MVLLHRQTGVLLYVTYLIVISPNHAEIDPVTNVDQNQTRERKSPLQEQRIHEPLPREKIFYPGNASDINDPRNMPPEWPWKTNETRPLTDIDDSEWTWPICYKVVLPENSTAEDGIFNYNFLKDKQDCVDINPAKPIVPYIVYSGSLQYGSKCVSPAQIEAEQRKDSENRLDKLKKLDKMTCEVSSGLNCGKSGYCTCFKDFELVRPQLALEGTGRIKCTFHFRKHCEVKLSQPPSTVFNPTLFEITKDLDIGKVSLTCPGTSFCHKGKCRCRTDDNDCPPIMKDLEQRFSDGNSLEIQTKFLTIYCLIILTGF